MVTQKHKPEWFQSNDLWAEKTAQLHNLLNEDLSSEPRKNRAYETARTCNPGAGHEACEMAHQIRLQTCQPKFSLWTLLQDI